MQNIVDWVKDYGMDNAWVYTAFIVIFITLVVNYVARIILLKIEHKATRTSTLWDDALIAALRSPLAMAIWIMGFSYVFKFIEKETQAGYFTRADEFTRVLILFLIGWFLYLFTKEVEKALLNNQDPEKNIDETSVSVLARLARMSIIITIILVVMQTLGYSISGLLAFGGVGGVAIGFAAKEMLANFFGAFMIYLDKPFKIGDWIRSPDQEIEGTVEEIGWRVTRIRKFDKRPLYVPNAAFTSISVENPSRMTHRRINETIGIRYGDVKCMSAIIEEVKAMLTAHEEIDSSQTLIVNFNAFSASSVDFFIYTFTKTVNWIRFHEVKQDVLLKIAEIIDKHGAEIAFPTRTLHMSENSVTNPDYEPESKPAE
jgi:MscS family membrane protein